MGDDLGVDVGLTYPAGDELGVLGAEVDDEDCVELSLHVRDEIGGREAHAEPAPSEERGTTMSSAFWNSLSDS